ncbi:MAG TPA: LysM peptidoglycan-binding domain-containing protein [Longimicrobiales bacterium]|nr:LysM peptidoglycan-binding domain-containing protein [Longimicrobiales bacterium]
MVNRRDWKMLLTGGAAMSAALLTAWSVRPEPPVEPAPMEEVLAEAEALSDDVVTWDITVTRNERVEDWIDFLTGRNRDRTKLWLERSGRYGPMIQAELRERGMPEDLLYLALIESGFSPKAYSSAAASGIWQFIAETGQRYGLEVTGVVDERRDPIKSTDAALDYLQDLYDRFGSWYLAAASYNTGENRVGRIMREMFGTERGTDEHFWKIAHRLPRETRDYVPLMLAAGHIAKEPEKYGFTDLVYQEPLSFDVTWVPGAVSLDAIARAVSLPVDSIGDLNTHLVAGATPEGRAWPVRLPSGTAEQFAVNFPRIFREVRAEAARHEAALANAPTHRVLRGETLSHIARRYGVSVGALQQANDNISPRRLQVGQVLRVPGRSGGAAVASSSAAEARFHQVRRGESLWTIARRYDVSMNQLRAWNGLSGRSVIHPGQKLRVTA